MGDAYGSNAKTVTHAETLFDADSGTSRATSFSFSGSRSRASDLIKPGPHVEYHRKAEEEQKPGATIPEKITEKGSDIPVVIQETPEEASEEVNDIPVVTKEFSVKPKPYVEQKDVTGIVEERPKDYHPKNHNVGLSRGPWSDDDDLYGDDDDAYPDDDDYYGDDDDSYRNDGYGDDDDDGYSKNKHADDDDSYGDDDGDDDDDSYSKHGDDDEDS